MLFTLYFQVSELMIMPCEHTFCCKCLRDIEQERRRKNSCKVVACPTCEASCPLPEAGMENMLNKKSLSSDESPQLSPNSAKTACTGVNCSNKKAVYYCCTGCKYLCQQCYALHKSMPFTKTHLTRPVSQSDQPSPFR